MMRIALIAVAALAVSLIWHRLVPAQNIITPRDTFLELLDEAQADPTHAIWYYISGLVGGANLGSIANTGKPMICDTHDFQDQEKTTEIIMSWLVRYGHLDNPDFLLEVAAPLAFAEAYPCNEI